MLELLEVANGEPVVRPLLADRGPQAARRDRFR
jgi:hypothetical protein